MVGLSPVDAMKARIGHITAAIALLRDNTLALRKELQRIHREQVSDKERPSGG